VSARREVLAHLKIRLYQQEDDYCRQHNKNAGYTSKQEIPTYLHTAPVSDEILATALSGNLISNALKVPYLQAW
jgi:hypothetical protein